jgi:hypothetical protein
MSGDVQIDQIKRRIDASRALAAPALEGYEIVAYLGAGTYGDVWEARDKSRTTVAIKRFREELSKQSCDEVEMLRGLDDARGIVKIKDVHLEREPHCYVMEFMRGGTLRRLIDANGGKLPFAKAWPIFRELVDALAYVHVKGAVHCDIKPENVLMDTLGRPRLSDFGQARSQHGRSLGTLFYMPPEQALLKTPDPQGDVYALGAMLYEMLTGSRPRYDEKLAKELTAKSQTTGEMRQRLNQYARHLETAPDPRDHRRVAGVDRAAARIIERCLAIDLDVRAKDAAAVQKLMKERDTVLRNRPLLLLNGRILPALLCCGVVLVFVVGMLTLQGFQREWKQQVVAENQAMAQAIALATRARFDERLHVMERESKNPNWLRMLETVRDQNAVEPYLEEVRKLHDAEHAMREDQQVPVPIKKLLETTEGTYKSVDQVFDRLAIGDARGASLGLYGRFNAKHDAQTEAEESPTWDLLNFGVDYSWRGWFNGEADEKPQAARLPTAKSAQEAQSRLAKRIAKGHTVALTHPYRRKSGEEDNELWTLTISCVIHTPDKKPVGVLCGQIDHEEFNENISGVERSGRGSSSAERVVVVANQQGQTIYHPELSKKVSSNTEGRVFTINERRNDKRSGFFKEPFEWTNANEPEADPIDPHPQEVTYKDPWNDHDETTYFVGRAVARLHNGQKLAVFVMESQDKALQHFSKAQKYATGLFLCLLPLVVGVFVGNWILYRKLSRPETSDDA